MLHQNNCWLPDILLFCYCVHFLHYRFQWKQTFRFFYSYRLQCTLLISSMQYKICSLRPFYYSASLIAPMHTKVHSLSAKVVTGKNDRETIPFITNSIRIYMILGSYVTEVEKRNTPGLYKQTFN